MKFILTILLIVLVDFGTIAFCSAVFYEEYIEPERDKIYRKYYQKWFYFWLALAISATVAQIYWYVSYYNNHATELLKYTECSNNYCGTTEDMCKTDERIISCKEYTHYNKKIIEERYLYVVPYCNDNTWDAKICKLLLEYHEKMETKMHHYDAIRNLK